MVRRHTYGRRKNEPTELVMTTFFDLMVVLVPFLLITAVFSRITIVELSLTSSAGGPAPTDPGFQMEVIVRGERLELSNVTSVIATIPKRDDEYDLETLLNMVMSLKCDDPNDDGASVLLEPNIE